ncbi:MAG: protein kinase [Lentisphaerae bacterium]|nr:protein kinase [Lentisphaerota bacterium]
MNSEPPAPSAMPVEDAELLRQKDVRPPSKLGSIGRLGKFEIVKLLGQGGMAQVYLATEPVTGTSVALKMLRSEMAEDPRVVKSFLAEARHMYGLSHPNILKVLEVSAPDEGAFFVMPLVRTGSLDERISSTGMTVGEAVEICIQVADGLAYAHGKGLIHRDLKPANVLLDENDRAMIADFGLVRPFFNDSMMDVKESQLVGTPAYMSPRVASGLAEDTRADIYAFGAMMYEMIAGHAPYRGSIPMALVQAVIEGPPEPLSSVNRQAPPGIVAIAEWCMSRELRDRYASMNDVLDDLRRYRAGEAPRGPHGTAARKVPTRALVIGIATGVLVAAIPIAVAIFAALRRPRRELVTPYPPQAEKADPSTPPPPAAVNLPAVAGPPVVEEPDAARQPPVAEPPPAPVQEVRTDISELLRKADASRKSGDFQDADAKYREILARDPDNARALFGMGVMALERGMRPTGTEHLRRASESDPGDAEISGTLAKHLMEIGHLAPARHVITEWLAADPGNEDAEALLKRLEESENAGGTDGHDRPPGREPPPRPGEQGARRPPDRSGGRRPPSRGPR